MDTPRRRRDREAVRTRHLLSPAHFQESPLGGHAHTDQPMAQAVSSARSEEKLKLIEGSRKARALELGQARHLLRAAMGDSGPEILEVLSASLVSEFPARLAVRYQARILRAGRRETTEILYGRFYRGRKGKRVLLALGFLRDIAPAFLAFPEVFGYSRRHRLLVLGPVAGASLQKVIWPKREGSVPIAGFDVQCSRALESLGAAAALFHGAFAPARYGGPARKIPLPIRHATDEVRGLERASAAMAGTGFPPQFVESFEAAVRDVCRRLGSGGLASRDVSGYSPILRRGFRPGGIILSKGQIGFVELDHAAVGEREVDLGNLAARLIHLNLRRFGRGHMARHQIQRVLAAYRTRLPVREDRLEIHAASALLRLAFRNRSFEPEGTGADRMHLAGQLLQEANVWLRR